MTGDVVTDARVRPGARLEGPYVEVELDNRGARYLRCDHRRERRPPSRDRARQHGVLRAGDQGADSRRSTCKSRGSFSFEEAHELAIVLRSGALPAPVEIEEERTVGPSLGRDSIRQGEMSFIVGAVAVLVFMAVYYSGAGICSPTSA